MGDENSGPPPPRNYAPIRLGGNNVFSGSNSSLQQQNEVAFDESSPELTENSKGKRNRRRKNSRRPSAKNNKDARRGKKGKANKKDKDLANEELEMADQLAQNAVTLSKIPKQASKPNIAKKQQRHRQKEDDETKWQSTRNPNLVLSPIQSTNYESTMTVFPGVEYGSETREPKPPLNKRSSKAKKGKGNKPTKEQTLKRDLDPQISGLTGSVLEETFNSAVNHMRAAKLVVAPEDMLLLYGLYKQVTIGDCYEKQPSPTQFVANQKWIAWKARRGTSKELAMQLYIQKVRQLDSSFQLEQKSAEKLGNEQTSAEEVEGFVEMEIIPSTPVASRAEFNRFLRSNVMSFRANAPLVPSRLSNDIKIESHKSYISEYDIKRYTMLKIQKQTQSVRFSSIPSPKPAQYRIPEVDPRDPYRTIQKLVLKICTEFESKSVDMQTEDTFSGSEKPAISLFDFVFRMVRYLDKWFNDQPSFKSVGVRSLLISTVYLKRINERIGDEFAITDYNVHRLFAVCMLLAAKFSEDYIIANSYWAEVAGIEMKELNEIEEQFCNLCGFDLYISDALLAQLYDQYAFDV